MISRILTIGESVADIVVAADGSRAEHPGGSPLNVAVALGRLGHDSTLLTRIGEDERGSRIAEHLATSHVSLADGSITTDPTSTALARLAADGSADYEFDLTWEVRTRGAPAQIDAIHTGSLAAVLAPGASAVKDLIDARRGHGLISYDPNARPALMGDAQSARAAVESMIARTDVVKASDEDVAWLYGLDVADRAGLEDVVDSWRSIGPALTVLTRGSEGATAFHASGRVAARSEPVDVADTIGAGDTFTAGILDALLLMGAAGRGARTHVEALEVSSIGRILEHAARLAAVTVSRPGADPPWASEVR